MAFKMFVAEKASKGVKGTDGERLPSVKFIPNGKTSVLLIFLAESTKQFGLKEGDKINLAYDAATGRVGVVKDNKNGTITLLQHGDSTTSLKAAVTPFFKVYLGHLAKRLPYKVTAKMSTRTGMIVFSATEGKTGKKRGRKAKAKVDVAATTEVAPAKRGRPAGSRKVETANAPTT